jgi:hypothetical protein
MSIGDQSFRDTQGLRASARRSEESVDDILALYSSNGSEMASASLERGSPILSHRVAPRRKGLRTASGDYVEDTAEPLVLKMDHARAETVVSPQILYLKMETIRAEPAQKTKLSRPVETKDFTQSRTYSPENVGNVVLAPFASKYESPPPRPSSLSDSIPYSSGIRAESDLILAESGFSSYASRTESPPPRPTSPPRSMPYHRRTRSNIVDRCHNLSTYHVRSACLALRIASVLVSVTETYEGIAIEHRMNRKSPNTHTADHAGTSLEPRHQDNTAPHRRPRTSL